MAEDIIVLTSVALLAASRVDQLEGLWGEQVADSVDGYRFLALRIVEGRYG